MLPAGPWQIKVRSDSAAYQQDVLDHWQKRGWQFAVSADMSQGLKIEYIHHILDSELAGGVYPSGKHGTNAAWLRLQVLTHNLLQLFKATALPEEYATAHPKRLRFAIFTQLGRVINHAGQLFLRVTIRA